MNKYRFFHIGTYVLAFIAGATGGFIAASTIHFEAKLTLDAIISSVVAFAAIMAATIILPLRIQPLLQKFNGMNAVAQEDIRRLLKHIEILAELYRAIYESGNEVTVEQRRSILDRQTKIMSISGIILKQSPKLSALKDFKVDVDDPLTSSETGIAVKVYPGVKIDEELYLELKGDLDKISYKLIELRYELN